LLQDTIERSRAQVIIGLSGHCHHSRFFGMLVLAMAASRPVHVLAVFGQHLQNVTDLHSTLPQALIAMPYTLLEASNMASASVGCA